MRIRNAQTKQVIMTTEKLEKANDLLNEIKSLERIIKNAENKKCEWIQFTFGNGSSREMVCNDAQIIDKVRSLLILENNLKLDRLKMEFKNL